jgi:hypothetical protein
LCQKPLQISLETPIDVDLVLVERPLSSPRDLGQIVIFQGGIAMEGQFYRINHYDGNPRFISDVGTTI